VQDYKDVDEDLRFALFDLNDDDRISEEELVGEAIIKTSAISGGSAVTLSLTKGGKPVPDAFILLNTSTQVKAALVAQVEAKERAAADARFKESQERNSQAAAKVAAQQQAAAAQEAYNKSTAAADGSITALSLPIAATYVPAACRLSRAERRRLLP